MFNERQKGMSKRILNSVSTCFRAAGLKTQIARGQWPKEIDFLKGQFRKSAEWKRVIDRNAKRVNTEKCSWQKTHAPKKGIEEKSVTEKTQMQRYFNKKVITERRYSINHAIFYWTVFFAYSVAVFLFIIRPFFSRSLFLFTWFFVLHPLWFFPFSFAMMSPKLQMYFLIIPSFSQYR